MDKRSPEVELVIRNRSKELGPMRPTGVAAWDDVIAVTDVLRHSVRVFSALDGSLVREYGHGLLKFPYAVGVLDNKLYCADAGRSRIVVFARDTGALLFSLEREFSNPTALAIDHRRRQLLVADTNRHRIQVLSSDGAPLLEFGRCGDRCGELYAPSGVAVLADGRIVVADSSNDRVQVFSSNGEFLYTLLHAFYRPRGVWVDHQDRILVADMAHNSIVAFASDGTYLDSYGKGRGYFQLPFAVTSDAQGRVIVADTSHGCVQVIGAARWLPEMWRPELHALASEDVKRVVLVVTMVRSLEHTAAISLLPNELLFEIFSWL